MLDRYLLDITKNIQQRVAQQFINKGVTANQVTWMGFAIGITALPLIAFHCYGLAIIAIVLNRIADGLDGTIARLTHPTDRGGFLDITLDFLFYSSVPVGFALANPEVNALPATILIYSFIGTGCSFLAFAIIAAQRKLESTAYPEKGFYYLGGLTEASETIGVFLLMCLLPDNFPVFAYVFAALCFITTALRIRAGWEVFNDTKA